MSPIAHIKAETASELRHALIRLAGFGNDLRDVKLERPVSVVLLERRANDDSRSHQVRIVTNGGTA